MTVGDGVRWARRNWISCLLMAAIITALNWGPRGEASTEVSAEAATAPEPVPPASGATSQDELRAALDDAIYRNRVQERERITAQSPVEAQLDALDEGAEPYEYAARLCALGNLYQQKHGDYETAAGYYEVLLEDYGDWPGIASAYHQLIACYTYLDEPQELRLLYHKMVGTFPEGSPEHTYALHALER